MTLQLNGIDIGVFVTFIVLVLGVGLFAARRTVGTKKDYFLAGDKLPWWMVGGSMVAANISTHHFVGIMGIAYTRGFSVMFIEWGAVFTGLAALFWVFLPYYLRNGFYTTPEFLARRFGPAARTAFTLLMLLTYVFVEISAVLYLGALVFQSLLGIHFMYCVVGMALLTGIYTVAGGLRAVVWTEMLQLAVLTAGGMTLAFLVLAKTGGLAGFLATSKDWHLLLPASDPDYPWTMYLGGLTCISVFYIASNQFIVQRCFAAKNEWHAKMGVVFYGYFTLIRPWMTIVPGIMAVQLYPNLAQPDLVFPTLVTNLLPAGLVGLVIAGLVAAVMSHVSGALNACMTLASVDLYQTYFNKHATDQQVVRFGKIVGVVLMCIGVVWAPWIAKSGKQVFNYLLDAYSYFTPGIAAMFLLGIFWKRATHAGALTAGILTIPLSIALHLLVPKLADLNRAGVVFWTCLVAMVVVSLFTKPKPEAELVGLIWSKDSLSLPPDQRHLVRGLRNPTLWYLLLLLFVACMYVKFR